MRVAVLGGTRFIGPAIVEALVQRGHTPVIVHRGRHALEDLPHVARLHCDRNEPATLAAALRNADALVDTCAASRQHAELASSALPTSARAVVLSSIDVYRAFGTVLRDGPATDAVPLDETSAIRPPEARYPFRGLDAPPGRDIDFETYDKLDVEAAWLARGALALRLPIVFGERDWQRREEFVLRRVRARRDRIPIGAGTWLCTRVYVRDVARAVVAAVESSVNGVLNLGEAGTVSIAHWVRRIIAAAGWPLSVVTVPDALVPDDLSLTRSVAQHLVVDSSRARATLHWTDTDPSEALRASVRWHLAHPPDVSSTDFVADDHALAEA